MIKEADRTQLGCRLPRRAGTRRPFSLLTAAIVDDLSGEPAVNNWITIIGICVPAFLGVAVMAIRLIEVRRTMEAILRSLPAGLDLVDAEVKDGRGIHVRVHGSVSGRDGA